MLDHPDVHDFLRALGLSVRDKTLRKLTLSKPHRKQAGAPGNLYGRLVALKDREVLQLTYRYDDREEVKNYPPDEGLRILEESLAAPYLQADLFSTIEHRSLSISRKGNARLLVRPTRDPLASGPLPKALTPAAHDRPKHRDVTADRPFLRDLGITNKDGIVLPAGKRKFKQINKFVEIVRNLLADHPLPPAAHIVDLGSGSGYLTFALYDHLTNEMGLDVRVTGVELRPKLVEKCRAIAAKHDFRHLHFEEGYIDTFSPAQIDMLIALHACDTATDDALALGIGYSAKVMVVAPCCQKQVRRDMVVPEALRPMLDHGILLERQAAMLTDSVRELLLQTRGYRTKLFEFIPLEHTAKNVMITAVLAPEAQVQGSFAGTSPAKLGDKIAGLKTTFGIQRHHLEELLAKTR